MKMKRKALFLILIVAAVMLAYLYTRPPATVLSIEKVYGVTEVGQTVLINVTLIDIQGCTGWLMNLLWDPYYVTLTPRVTNSSGTLPYEVTEGPFMKEAGPTRNLVIDSVNDLGGQIIVGDQFASSGYSASGTGVIMTINFTVVHVGTTTLMTAPLSSVQTQSLITGASGQDVAHVEVMGLITDNPAPPFWEGTNFQIALIAGDVLVLLVATGIAYQLAHPRPPKSERRKEALQPILEPKDESESS
jgi:hypothetical protein